LLYLDPSFEKARRRYRKVPAQSLDDMLHEVRNDLLTKRDVVTNHAARSSALMPTPTSWWW
jgi:hypothetical protein